MRDEERGLPRRPVRTLPEHELRTVTRGHARSSSEFDLVHLTTTGLGREIVKARKLENKLCPVFTKPLTYFFFGRPVYRLPHGDEKSEVVGRFPLAFLVSPTNLGPPYHVYPFDTGAASRGWFNAKISPGDYLDDFELEPSIDAALDHVGWAFDDNLSYFEGDLRSGIDTKIEEWNSVARGFIKIAGLAASGNNSPDKRAAAVEIAYNNNLTLRGNLRLVICPKQFIENVRTGTKNEQFIASLKTLGSDPVLEGRLG